MKKVLIITYYWPPAGGPGVQRVLKFAKYLPEFGWQPIILTVKKPTSPARDESLVASIPSDAIVYKTRSIEPFGVYKKFTGKKSSDFIPKDIIVEKTHEPHREKLSRWFRANIFIPDARIGWIPFLILKGLKVIHNEQPELIFSTSPPHSLQLASMYLAKLGHLKWIADFRDPWLEAYWESEISKNRISHRLNSWYEKRVLKNSDCVTTVSPGIVELLRSKTPNRYECLYNGFGIFYDEFKPSDKFKIVFFGNLSKYQSPKLFFDALTSCSDTIKKQTEVYFVGKIFDDYNDLIHQYSELNIILQPYLAFDELMMFCSDASLMLLIFHQTSYTLGYITAKMFDYLALRRPILAIGLKGGIGEQILVETESGQLFNYQDLNKIQGYIESIFNKWKENGSTHIETNLALNQYSTRENVRKLAKIFEEVTQ